MPIIKSFTKLLNVNPVHSIVKVSHKRIIPPVVIELGDLEAVIYKSEKWSPGEKRTYIHYMENPPKLVANPQGTQLYIVGGTYRVTSRGIVG
ncbi:MAG: hypothetical protein ACE5I1_21495 [bacterium]